MHRPLEITFYSRQRCCLCDDAKAVLQPIIEEFDATLRVVDVDSLETLRQRFGGLVPVVEIDGRVVATYHVDPEQARGWLRDATARRSS